MGVMLTLPTEQTGSTVFVLGPLQASSDRASTETCAQCVPQTLVTKQTGPAGKPVNTLYIANKMKLKNEMYFAMLLDRGTMGPMIIACSEGDRPYPLCSYHIRPGQSACTRVAVTVQFWQACSARDIGGRTRIGETCLMRVLGGPTICPGSLARLDLLQQYVCRQRTTVGDVGCARYCIASATDVKSGCHVRHFGLAHQQGFLGWLTFALTAEQCELRLRFEYLLRRRWHQY